MDGFTRFNAVPVMPDPPPSPGPAGWCSGGTPGVPGSGPTYVGYEWYNAVWAELKAILTAAGITPDAANLAQILQALHVLFVDTAELAAAIATRVAKSGDTMSGHLGLPGDPSDASHASRKAYVDGQVATRVWKGGDTMSGHLGLPGDPSDPSHAARKAYVDGTNVLSSNGYKRLPGGLIIQWGVVAGATQAMSATATVVFPLTFPGGCFVVIPTIEGFDGAGLMDVAAATGVPTSSGVDLYAGTVLDEGTEVRTFGWRWMALGV